ncbi:CRISPR-associated protein Cas4 [Aerococcus tenax]|uniref:CRISPR-associated protein Cas4 n=1 Tax=Aerococcus tenax TaxID=3078812 RepID=UPI0018A73E48|nr:CRISPR-associated protein Cas4 [Aerococcus tenax]
MAYDEDDYLMLSGIQHFYYSKRQWCLIHLEQQWADNQYTIEGQLLHEKADNPYLKEKRRNHFISRAVPVSSKQLGLTGILDVVEFTKDEERGVELANRKGKWLPRIIEFKRGKPKQDLRDIVQLVAEVICLEENLNTSIEESYLFYGKTQHRVKVEITQEYRQLVQELADEMHETFAKQENVGLSEAPDDKGDSLRDISLSYALRPDFNYEAYMFKTMDDDLT